MKPSRSCAASPTANTTPPPMAMERIVGRPCAMVWIVPARMTISAVRFGVGCGVCPAAAPAMTSDGRKIARIRVRVVICTSSRDCDVPSIAGSPTYQVEGHRGQLSLQQCKSASVRSVKAVLREGYTGGPLRCMRLLETCEDNVFGCGTDGRGGLHGRGGPSAFTITRDGRS